MLTDDRAHSLAFTPLIVSYSLEILPYSLRAKGFNVFNFTISVALIFNQYVNPIALKNIGWKYYVSAPTAISAHRPALELTLMLTTLVPLQIVYCCWLAFETVFLYFFVVETRNRTLEETAALFDGEELEKLHQVAHQVVASEVRHEDYDEKSSDPGLKV